ncbi:MAG: 16S rRNA (adenine(1518)-N(6)/adenine(1519)-N(6))-dimethyltransferase RsmA [Pseudomonadota bacterium]
MDGLPPLREVIRSHGLKAHKALGQNYLLDLNLTAKIARSVYAPAGAPRAGPKTIVEVGPGPGGLTRALLAEGEAAVLAIEKDRRFLPALEAIAAAYPGRLTIDAADALRLDWSALLAPLAQPLHCAGNLPYNIASELLIRWLLLASWPPPFASLTLMFQKEVADRLTAPPGGKPYGRLSVLAQWRARPTALFSLPATAFTPKPAVASTLVRLEINPAPADADPEILQKVTAAAFGQRRKTLRQSLKTLIPAPEPVLAAAGIDPQLRAEALDVKAFCALARAVSASSC